MLNLLCASDFTFNPCNIQNLNFMGVDLMVLRNTFPPSQLQKRQSKTTEGQAKSKAIPLHLGY